MLRIDDIWMGAHSVRGYTHTLVKQCRPAKCSCRRTHLIEWSTLFRFWLVVPFFLTAVTSVARCISIGKYVPRFPTYRHSDYNCETSCVLVSPPASRWCVYPSITPDDDATPGSPTRSRIDEDAPRESSNCAPREEALDPSSYIHIDDGSRAAQTGWTYHTPNRASSSLLARRRPPIISRTPKAKAENVTFLFRQDKQAKDKHEQGREKWKRKALSPGTRQEERSKWTQGTQKGRRQGSKLLLPLSGESIRFKDDQDATKPGGARHAVPASERREDPSGRGA